MSGNPEIRQLCDNDRSTYQSSRGACQISSAAYSVRPSLHRTSELGAEIEQKHVEEEQRLGGAMRRKALAQLEAEVDSFLDGTHGILVHTRLLRHMECVASKF